MWDIYNHLGDDKTIAVIALMNGFVSGYSLAYSGLIVSKASIDNVVNGKVTNDIGLGMKLLPIFFGIVCAIIMKYIAVFVVGLLPLRLKPMFGLSMLFAGLYYFVNMFNNIMACMIVNAIK